MKIGKENNQESGQKASEKGSMIVEESINNSGIASSQGQESGVSESVDIPNIKKTQSSPVGNETQPSIMQASED